MLGVNFPLNLFLLETDGRYVRVVINMISLSLFESCVVKYVVSAYTACLHCSGTQQSLVIRVFLIERE